MDWSWLPAVGSSAAALVVMYFSLAYIRHRDEDAKILMDRVEGLAGRFDERLESMKNDFLKTLGDMRIQNQQITDTLFGVAKESVQTMAIMSTKLGDLSDAIDSLKTEVERKEDRRA